MTSLRSRYKRLIYNTICSAGLVVACLHAQVENAHLNAAVSNLLIEAFAFESDLPGTGRIDIYVQIHYPEISFVKDGEQNTG